MNSVAIVVFGLLLAPVSVAQDVADVVSERSEAVADVVSERSEAVATIAAYDGDGRLQGIGTGFIIEDGVIITSEHVVRDAAYIGSTFSDAMDGEIDGVGHVDDELDLAVLTTSSKIRSKGLTVSERQPEIGSEIVVIGSPMGLSNNVATGTISAFKSIGKVDLLQISARVSQGSSGSPVLNKSGEVIGIITSQFDGDQDTTFAVSAKHLRELIGNRQSVAESARQKSLYSIVVSSEITESSANDVALNYRSKGYDAQVLSFKVGDAVRFRVCLGHYDNKGAAISDRERLAGGGIPSDAWVIAMP